MRFLGTKNNGIWECNTKNEKKKTWLVIFILEGVPEFFPWALYVHGQICAATKLLILTCKMIRTDFSWSQNVPPKNLVLSFRQKGLDRLPDPIGSMYGILVQYLHFATHVDKYTTHWSYGYYYCVTVCLDSSSCLHDLHFLWLCRSEGVIWSSTSSQKPLLLCKKGNLTRCLNNVSIMHSILWWCDTDPTFPT